jgi:YgiT-type zinc finger domain-containing protein
LAELQEQGPAPLACSSCGAATHEDSVRAAFWTQKGLIAIEDIPARVCECCGEQYYDDHTAHLIEKLLNSTTVIPQREMVVPVFSLANRVEKNPE